MTDAVPGAPTGATAARSGVHLGRYRGTACTNFVPVGQVTGKAASYADGGRTRNTTYRYRVRRDPHVGLLVSGGHGWVRWARAGWFDPGLGGDGVGYASGVSARGSARVGCSGWQYRDWRGVVYPAELPQRSWLAYYATLFDTVEVNNTFYRLPSESAVNGWAASVPPGFVFALKLGAFGSHRMKLRDAVSWLPNHMVRVTLLGDAAGPTLVQLPPRWRRNAERLDEFLSVAPPTTRWAVEVRERSWLHDEVYDVLERHHAALCVHDLLEDHPFQLTTDWTYVRFHGPAALVRKYYGAYGYRRLRRWATRLNEVLDSGRDVYCYFNNDWEGHAVADASWLRRALESRESR